MCFIILKEKSGSNDYLLIANYFNNNLPRCFMNAFCTSRVLFLPALFGPPVRDCQGCRFCIFRRGEFP